MRLPLLLLLGDDRCLMLCQSPPNRSRLLRAKIQWEVLLFLVKKSELGALLGVDVGEDAGDGFADVMTGAILASMCGERREWIEGCGVGDSRKGEAHILVSLAAAPPEIFCVRS